MRKKMMSYAHEMNYRMELTIENPENEEQKYLFLDCWFEFGPEQYGNGHFLYIKGDLFAYYDLRYDKSFDRFNKALWLAKWAYAYWSGDNGAWRISELKIIHIDD